MQNIETKEYRYFKVYENQNILLVPYKISKHVLGGGEGTMATEAAACMHALLLYY